MRHTAIAFSLLLTACAGIVQGPAPDPGPLPEVRAIVEAHGHGGFRSTFNGYPLTAAFRWQGNGELEFVYPPGTLYFDGDADFVVEPAPGETARARELVASGRVVILRAGRQGGLNPPGSVAARLSPPEAAPAPAPVEPEPKSPAGTDELDSPPASK